MGPIHGVHRHEVLLLPERLDDSLAADNPVRCLDAWGDELDRAAYGFRRAVPAATGRPGYAPGDLWKRYLHGDPSRLRASRCLGQEGPRHVALLWLLKQRRPDHTTMANFRKNNLEPPRHVCRTCTLLGKQLALCGAELVGSEASQCRAVNAKERHFTPAKLPQRLMQIDAHIAASLTELDCRDTEAERRTGGGAHAAAVAAQREALQQRQLRDEGFQAQLRSHSLEQLSLTDPESRSMKGSKGRGTEVGYHVRTAVDAKHQLIVACEVTNEPGDRDWLSPMALQAQEVLACRFAAVADRG
ncbi:MAG TPA: hypothetical protein VIH59_27425 [Candidatus Tectomicrobia bacterium]|jgi:transposase